jgi:hypothetical protein
MQQPQFKPYAKEELEHLYSDIEWLIENSHDPIAVVKLARKIEKRIRDKIEPRLRRNDPTVDERLDDLERQMAELQERKIVQFEQRRKAE